MLVARRRSRLGASALEDLARGFSNAVTQDATTWLVQQYATLRTLPQRLRALSSLQQRILPYTDRVTSASTPAIRAQLISQGSKIAELLADFPPMLAKIDQAYNTVQTVINGATPAGDLTSVATSTIGAIVEAKQFVSDVDAVDNALNAVVGQLVTTEAITREEAAALMVPQNDGWSWQSIALVALVVGGGFYFLTRRGRRG